MGRILVTLSLTVAVVATASLRLDAQGSRDVPLPADELPVSRDRIKRQLDRLPPTQQERSLLRLNYYIDVYGRSPRINIVRGFDVYNGPVPYGSPTHGEMLEAMSSREHRPPVVNLNGVIGWTFRSLNGPR